MASTTLTNTDLTAQVTVPTEPVVTCIITLNGTTITLTS